MGASLCYGKRLAKGARTLETMVAVFWANALTVAIVYGAWRVKRNERDLGGLLWLLLPLAFVAGIAGISKWEARADRPSTPASEARLKME